MKFEIDDFASMKAALERICAAFEEEEVPEGAVFNCKLVANELLTNALRYGGGRARLQVVRMGSEIRISVKGEIDFVPPEKSSCSGVDAERGRGLYLVDAVSESRLYSKEEGICVTVKILT